MTEIGGQLSAGIGLTTDHGLDLSVDYEGQIGGDSESHKGGLTLVYRF